MPVLVVVIRAKSQISIQMYRFRNVTLSTEKITHSKSHSFATTGLHLLLITSAS